MFDLVADPGLVEDELVGEPRRCCGVIYAMFIMWDAIPKVAL